MFESQEQKDPPNIFRWIIRIFYLSVVSFVAIATLLIYLFPGTTLEERRGRGINGMGGLLLMVSMALAAPLIPNVLWKLFVKRELPGFWGIVFLVAAFPLISMFVIGIIFH